MADRQGQSEQAQRNAEKLERQARDMYEKLSPQEKKRLEEWAKQMARERRNDPTRPPAPRPPSPRPPSLRPGDSGRPDSSQLAEGPRDRPPESPSQPDRLTGAPGAPDPTGTSGDPRTAGRSGAARPPAPANSSEAARTTPLDARSKGAPEDARVLAEWFNPEAPNDAANAGQQSVSDRVIEQQLREAIKSADQAFEEQSIPARYRNAREYFDRRFKELQSSKPAAPVQPAPPPAPAAQEPAKKP